MEASHDTQRLYHSRAARDDRDGPFPLQEDTKRSDVALHALRDGQLFHAPPKMPPGSARPVFGLRVLRLSCSWASPRFWQAGWNRGAQKRGIVASRRSVIVIENASPLIPGVKHFCFPQKIRRNYHA